MPRYLLFAGHKHYPQGGIDDLKGSFDSFGKALEWFESNPEQISDSYIDHWCQIVDEETLKVLGRFEQGFEGTVSEGTPGPVTVVFIDPKTGMKENIEDNKPQKIV